MQSPSEEEPGGLISEEDSVFTDADEEPGRHLAGGGGRTGRRLSVSERVHNIERPSQAAPSVSQKRRRVSSHGQQPSAGLDELALSQIKGLIEAGNATVLLKLDRLEARLESFEKRLECLEHDGFENSTRTDRMERELTQLRQENLSLSDQVNSMDTNHRLDSLILKCQDFGRRNMDEDIEEKTRCILNSRFEWLSLSRHDLQVAHRLQADDTVICKFVRRSVRDQIYDSRFRQNTRDTGHRLFINESLSQQNRDIMNVLVSAKKEGRIYTCFTRRGCPFFKETVGSSSRRVTSLEQLQTSLGAPLSRPPAPVGGRPRRPGERWRAAAGRRRTAGARRRRTAGARRRPRRRRAAGAEWRCERGR